MTPAAETLAYTRASAAAAAGVPAVTIDVAIESKELTAIRSGRRLVILREDLLNWLKLCKARGSMPSHVTQNDRERLAELNRARKRNKTAAAA